MEKGFQNFQGCHCKEFFLRMSLQGLVGFVQLKFEESIDLYSIAFLRTLLEFVRSKNHWICCVQQTRCSQWSNYKDKIKNLLFYDPLLDTPILYNPHIYNQPIFTTLDCTTNQIYNHYVYNPNSCNTSIYTTTYLYKPTFHPLFYNPSPPPFTVYSVQL